MLRDWDTFVAKVDSLLPKQSKKSIEKQAREIDRILASFIRGQLSVCVLLGTFYAVGLYIVGLDLGVLVGFLAGIISFIPYVGTIFGFVVSMAIAFAQFDNMMQILQVAGVFFGGTVYRGKFPDPETGRRFRGTASGLGYVCPACRRRFAGVPRFDDSRAGSRDYRRDYAACDRKLQAEFPVPGLARFQLKEKPPFKAVFSVVKISGGILKKLCNLRCL